jgi:HSP90 family molecular chaperone
VRAQSTSKEPARTPTQQTDAQRAAEQQERVDHYNQLVRDQQQLLREQEDRAKRVESLLERQEQLMTKQEAAFTRFEKILDTWEQQQKQYQKYLDSLKK